MPIFTRPEIALIQCLVPDIAPDQTVESSPAGTDAGWSPCHSGEGKPMSQGPRGGWARKLAIGIGAALCVTVVGCNEIDKPRLGGAAKQPGPGLPGTPTLSGQPGTSNARTGQPGMGAQPLGGAGTPVSRSPSGAYSPTGNTNFGASTGGTNFVPGVGPANNDYQPISNTPISPASGMGAGAAGGSFGGAPPSLATPELYAPAAPDARGAL